MDSRTDLTNPHDVESLRRSVAMLGPRQNGLVREDALLVLRALKNALEVAPPADR